jgi:hypothetical protein
MARNCFGYVLQTGVVMTDAGTGQDSEELPATPTALFAVATDQTVDPYRREAAIKHLGVVSGPAERYLERLTDGAAVSPIERSLATTVLSDRLTERTTH